MDRKSDNNTLDVTMETLEDIPLGELAWCFKQARKNNEYHSAPSDGKILKEWKKVADHRGTSDNIMRMMQERLKNQDMILNRGGLIRVLHPGEMDARKITPGEFINEAREYVNSH